MFLGCCGSFWCAVHYLGVLFRCTNTFVLCIPCNVVIKIIRRRKHEANDVKCSELGWLCIPLVVESYGAWGKEAMESFSSLASRLAITSSRPKSAVLSELYGRLNLNLVRANLRAMMSRYCPQDYF